jgi:hypothetical protein
MEKEEEIVVGLIVFAILAIVLMIYRGAGRPDTTCKGGYVFANTGHPTQILDEQGHGIPCEKK